jgi:hypothetical protein
VGHKNPWIAAILNFLLPGLGFLYCGTTTLVIGGALLLIMSLVSTLTSSQWLKPDTILLSLVESVALGVLGYGAAEIVNRSLPPPPTETHTPTPFLKNCSSCGRGIPLATEECPYCNASQKGYIKKSADSSQPPAPVPIPLSPSMSGSEDIYCIHCGTKNPSVAVFCRKCGEKIED